MNSAFFETIYQHPALSMADYREIGNAHRQTFWAKNATLIPEGRVSNAYYLVEKGLFRSYVIDFNGNEITTEFFTENEIVIEVSSLFQRIPAKENIQALTNARLWRIDYDVFQELFHQMEGFREWGRAWMANQLFISKQRSVNMLTQSATERYLHLMEERPRILQEAPLKYIASYLGVTDTSLSRIRKEISEKSHYLS